MSRGRLELPVGGCGALVFSPDGKRLAVCSRDVHVFDTTSGQRLCAFSGHSEGVSAAAFAPDGHLIATASNDATARLWDTDTGSELAVLSGHSGAVTTVAFSPDGKTLVTMGADGLTVFWQVGTGQEMLTMDGPPGVTALGNAGNGILVNGASHNTIGGEASGAGNLIDSHHQWRFAELCGPCGCPLC